MDLERVVKLLELMETHGLDEVEIEQDDIRIKLKKSGGAQMAATPAMATPMQITPVNGATANGAQAPDASVKEPEPKASDTTGITSPMVGTFYRAPTHDAESFVTEGDMVTPETVICIIEAMKVMNEIKAETEGEVVKILVENGESVEYGQPLMVIRKTIPGQ